jgi:sterol 24-C-methyltransferase
MSATATTTGATFGETRAYNSGERYRSTWGKAKMGEIADEERAERQKKAADINESYYDFITDHYEAGWGSKFHFAGYQPEEAWAAAAAREEHYIAYMTGIKQGDRVLDVGCGIGGPAREIAIFTGAHITGITINQMQVERGSLYTVQRNLTDQVNLVRANMIDMPFPDNHFDHAYSIEAMCLSPDCDKAISEVFRVLKPGGKFGFVDWLVTPLYDDSNEKHRVIRDTIERGSAVPHLLTAKAKIASLKKAGFEVLRDKDLALDKSNPIPWWYVSHFSRSVTS